MKIVYNTQNKKEEAELKKAYENLKKNCSIKLNSSSGTIVIEKYEIPKNWFKIFPGQKGLELKVTKKKNAIGLLTFEKFKDSAFYVLGSQNYKIYYKNPSQ